MRDNNEPHFFGSINRGSTPTHKRKENGKKRKRENRKEKGRNRREERREHTKKRGERKPGKHTERDREK
jgi:hypothetical protein